MPLVKFSGLVTAMKGKLGGSVFSVNSGGAYFRNNPSGNRGKNGQASSALSKFPFVTGQWKLLTTAQQEAWAEATPNFPTVNKFGDPRTPTAFELFCRLNGVLHSYSQPLILLPPNPRPFPSLESVSLSTPDLWLYLPTRAIFSADPRNAGSGFSFISDNSLPSGSIVPMAVISGRFGTIATIASSLNNHAEIILMSLVSDENEGTTVYCNDFTDTDFLLTVNFQAGEYRCQYTKRQPLALFINTFSVSVIMNEAEPETFQIWINGIEETFAKTITGAFGEEEATLFPSIFSEDNANCSDIFCSDFRLYGTSLTDPQMVLLSRGYVLDNEGVLLELTKFTDRTLLNYGSEGTNFNFSAAGVPLGYSPISAVSISQLPIMELTLSGSFDDSFSIILSASRPRSSGRNLTKADIKTISVYPYATNEAIDISSLYGEAFPFWPAGASTDLFARMVDLGSGVAQPAGAGKTRPKTKFKAGAELSTKVN